MEEAEWKSFNYVCVTELIIHNSTSLARGLIMYHTFTLSSSPIQYKTREKEKMKHRKRRRRRQKRQKEIIVHCRKIHTFCSIHNYTLASSKSHETHKIHQFHDIFPFLYSFVDLSLSLPRFRQPFVLPFLLHNLLISYELPCIILETWNVKHEMKTKTKWYFKCLALCTAEHTCVSV